MTGDQMARRTPEAEDRRKSRREQQVTAIGSAHKKEPPLGLEPRTYALRKRRRDDANPDEHVTCDNGLAEFAPEFAFSTAENSCELPAIPAKLADIIRLWPVLNPAMRDAVHAMVMAASGAPPGAGE